MQFQFQFQLPEIKNIVITFGLLSFVLQIQLYTPITLTMMLMISVKYLFIFQFIYTFFVITNVTRLGFYFEERTASFPVIIYLTVVDLTKHPRLPLLLQQQPLHQPRLLIIGGGRDTEKNIAVQTASFHVNKDGSCGV